MGSRVKYTLEVRYKSGTVTNINCENKSHWNKTYDEMIVQQNILGIVKKETKV